MHEIMFVITVRSHRTLIIFRRFKLSIQILLLMLPQLTVFPDQAAYVPHGPDLQPRVMLNTLVSLVDHNIQFNIKLIYFFKVEGF